ncbi:PAS domain S-box-containing protein [Flavobacterium fluvii]|uniref:histidine kinase n=1 Tax=Flavobacterium fluvii TaxID=468056 RepID=A0A1M5NFP9_9FLAO|nr:PAS domain S-box protein [Flavobacterium fluvii]SHG88350.1 PAS domain S-box-containing protein [Flavobacterium fluvii]
MEKERTLWSNFINWLSSRPKFSGFLLFFFLSFGTITVSFLRNQILKEQEQKEMIYILEEVHQNIEQSLKNCYTTSVSLALTLNNDGIPQNFDTIGKRLVESNPIVSVVELVPNGVIKYIYPLEGNKKAMNLNLLDSKDLRIEAEKSVETQKIYFAGPFKLRQDGIGIVGRLPIYHNNKFWGFTAVIIKLETLLKFSGIDAVDQTNYYFQLSKKNPNTSKEQFFLPEITDLSKSYYVSKPINDSDSVLYLVAKKQHIIYTPVLLSAILCFIIAILFGFLTTKLLKKPQELGVLLKEQETRLLKNEMKFKSVFDQSTIGFAIIDFNTVELLEANKKFIEMLGYTLEEIKSMGVLNLILPEDVDSDRSSTLKKLYDGQITEYFSEKRYLTKSGKHIWVNLTIYPLKENDDKPTSHIAFIKDITADREAREDLKNTLQLVTEQNKRLLNFSYIVSHNLRSHTSNIESIIDLIDSAESEDERKEMMSLLKSVSISLDETMNHLNKVVNINTNMSLTITPLNLKEYIEKAQDILSEQIKLNGATFVLDFPENTTINYNSAYLESILYNLISNAVRYRHPERKPIVTIKAYVENDKNVVEVSDNGIGIDLKKNGDKIFGMYKTFHNNSDARGIGLFITSNQVQSMGGTITVDSIPDVGTTFKIYSK